MTDGAVSVAGVVGADMMLMGLVEITDAVSSDGELQYEEPKCLFDIILVTGEFVRLFGSCPSRLLSKDRKIPLERGPSDVETAVDTEEICCDDTTQEETPADDIPDGVGPEGENPDAKEIFDDVNRSEYCENPETELSSVDNDFPNDRDTPDDCESFRDGELLDFFERPNEGGRLVCLNC